MPMGSAGRRVQRGFSVVELAITMLVLAILMRLGAPSFAAWIANQRIRARTLAGGRFRPIFARRPGPPGMVETEVDRDAIEPGRESCGGLITSRRAIQPEKRFLGDVIGHSPPTGDPVGESAEALLMPFDERAQRRH